MKIGDQPAFPSEQHETNDGAWNQTYDSGMTYRMWLVGQIAGGHAANSRMLEIQHSDEEIASFTILMADAIIKRLEEK